MSLKLILRKKEILIGKKDEKTKRQNWEVSQFCLFSCFLGQIL